MAAFVANSDLTVGICTALVAGLSIFGHVLDMDQRKKLDAESDVAITSTSSSSSSSASTLSRATAGSRALMIEKVASRNFYPKDDARIKDALIVESILPVVLQPRPALDKYLLEMWSVHRWLSLASYSRSRPRFYRIWTLYVYLLINICMQALLVAWYRADLSVESIVAIVVLSSIPANIVYYALQWLVFDNILASTMARPEDLNGFKTEKEILKEADSLMSDLKQFHGRLPFEERAKSQEDWFIYYSEDVPSDQVDGFSSSFSIEPSLLSKIIQSRSLSTLSKNDTLSFSRLSVVNRLMTLNEMEADELSLLYKTDVALANKSKVSDAILCALVLDRLPSLREEALYLRLVRQMRDLPIRRGSTTSSLYIVFLWIVSASIVAGLLWSLVLFSKGPIFQSYVLMWTAWTWSILEFVFVSHMNLFLLNIQIPNSCLSSRIAGIILEIIDAIEMSRSEKEVEEKSARADKFSHLKHIGRGSTCGNLIFDSSKHLALSHKLTARFPKAFDGAVADRFRSTFPRKVFGDLYSDVTRIVDRSNNKIRVVYVDNFGSIRNSSNNNNNNDYNSYDSYNIHTENGADYVDSINKRGADNSAAYEKYKKTEKSDWISSQDMRDQARSESVLFVDRMFAKMALFMQEIRRTRKAIYDQAVVAIFNLAILPPQAQNVILDTFLIILVGYIYYLHWKLYYIHYSVCIVPGLVLLSVYYILISGTHHRYKKNVIVPISVVAEENRLRSFCSKVCSALYDVYKLFCGSELFTAAKRREFWRRLRRNFLVVLVLGDDEDDRDGIEDPRREETAIIGGKASNAKQAGGGLGGSFKLSARGAVEGLNNTEGEGDGERKDSSSSTAHINDIERGGAMAVSKEHVSGTKGGGGGGFSIDFSEGDVGYSSVEIDNMSLSSDSSDTAKKRVREAKPEPVQMDSDEEIDHILQTFRAFKK